MPARRMPSNRPGASWHGPSLSSMPISGESRRSPLLNGCWGTLKYPRASMELMTPEAIFERAMTVADVRSNSASCKADVSRALVSTRQIRAWLDAQEAGLIRRLSEVDSFPEATIAEASKANLGQASKAKERHAGAGLAS
jgi:hypothetical protein